MAYPWVPTVLLVIVACSRFVGADTLSLASYIDLTLAHSPQVTIAAAKVAASDAARQGIRSRLLPQIDASAGLTRSDPGSATATKNSLSTGVSGRMLLFDFGKTFFQYRAAGLALAATSADQRGSLQEVVVEARIAYFTYLLSGQVLAVYEEALRVARLHRDEAEVLAQVGSQAASTVIRAKVDVANARVNVIRARNNRDLARVRLETVAGTAIGDPLVLTDSLSAHEEEVGLEDALTTADRLRPELLAARARIEADRLESGSSRAAYLPEFRGSAGYNWHAREWHAGDPSTLPPLREAGWSVGAALSMPLFQGGAVRANVRQADALLQQSEASLEAISRAVSQEIREAFLRKQEAAERIAATSLLVDQAAENLRLARERFRTGSGTALEVTDAEVTISDARSSHLEARFDYRVAHTHLLASMGAIHD